MPVIATRAGRMAFVRRGDGPLPLACIHGAGGSHRHWGLVAGAVADLPLMALDLPGHGRSQGPALSSVTGAAEAVLALVAALGVGRVVLVGHSLGGAVALALALARPDLVAGLVLVNSAARLRLPPWLLDQLDDDAALRALAELLFAPDADPALRQAATAELLSLDREVLRADYRACADVNLIREVAQLDVPVVALWGSADRLTPPNESAATLQELPSATHHVLFGAGHMLPLEAPAAVAQAMRDLRARLLDGAAAS